MIVWGLSMIGCSKPIFTEPTGNASYVGMLVLQNGEQYYWDTVGKDLEIGDLILEIQERIAPQFIPKEGQSNMLAKGTPVYRVKDHADKVVAITADGQYVFKKRNE